MSILQKLFCLFGYHDVTKQVVNGKLLVKVCITCGKETGHYDLPEAYWRLHTPVPPAKQKDYEAWQSYKNTKEWYK